MKHIVKLIIATLICIPVISCATTPEPELSLPPAPVIAESPAEAAPVEVKKQETAKAAEKQPVVQVVTPTEAPAVEVEEEVAAPTLEERIDQLGKNSTTDEVYALIVDLSTPGNDPDGTLTAKALAKGMAIAENLIDTAYTTEELQYYKSLLNEAKAAYGEVLSSHQVDLDALSALADERECGIEAYNADRIYIYIKNYPKGRYTKELADLLTQKRAGNL